MVIEASQKPRESHSASDLNPTSLEENVNAPLLERRLLLQTIPHLISALHIHLETKKRGVLFFLSTGLGSERRLGAAQQNQTRVCLFDRPSTSALRGPGEPASHWAGGWSDVIGGVGVWSDVTQRSWPALHPARHNHSVQTES